MIRYQITDGSSSLSQLRADADFIQIRERRLTARALARFTREAMSAVSGPRILVNDRVDIAIACGAAGVHLRSAGISPARIRAMTPPGFLISVSCHGEDDTLAAAGADFVILAPIFLPRSKEDSREPLGLEALGRIARRSPVPVIALGGITEANAPSCLRAGAAGVAGISLFR